MHWIDFDGLLYISSSSSRSRKQAVVVNQKVTFRPLNFSTKRYLGTISHEIWHMIKETNPLLFRWHHLDDRGAEGVEEHQTSHLGVK